MLLVRVMRRVLLALALCACRDPARPLELSSAAGAKLDPHATRPTRNRDPLALARASVGKIHNADANIPPLCYARTGPTSNPCWVCHTHSEYPNLADDWELQQNYSFPDTAIRNPWRNQFRDRRAVVAKLDDAEILAYIRTDNYAALRTALSGVRDFAGWTPDLDLAAGFDPLGFARDGSDWRAVRYKPFPGSFWPTTGSTGDVFVRLPPEFRRTADGQPSRAIYQTNLAILEAAIASDTRRPDADLVRAIEPIDERVAAIDLDRDGALGTATSIVGLPASYAGGAAHVRVIRALYPAGTELAHSVRYVDPDAPDFAARRMKELRYSRKLAVVERGELAAAYKNLETEARPAISGDPLTGVRNEMGWQLQGWIEDAEGWLRLQTQEEHQYCMGCHTGIGVTVDQTFAFARKVPGRDGWRPQDPRGIRDVPQVGSDQPEYALYLSRLGTPLDRATAEEVRGDITRLIFPSRAQAIALDRAYLANVLEQSYVWGRDAVITPVPDVHSRIDVRSTGIGEAGGTVRDGRLQLAW